MSRSLDALIQSARDDAPCFDADRGLEKAIARHERRVVRGRVVRRAMAAASAVAVVTVMLLRAGSSSADAPTVVAAAAANDAGYAHD